MIIVIARRGSREEHFLGRVAVQEQNHDLEQHPVERGALLLHDTAMKKSYNAEDGERFGHQLLVHGFDEAFVDLRLNEQERVNRVVGVAIIAAIRASVLNAAQVADEGQEHLDEHGVALVAINGIGGQCLRYQLHETGKDVLCVTPSNNRNVVDEHVQKAELRASHLLVARIILSYRKCIAHEDLQNGGQQKRILRRTTRQCQEAVPLHKQRNEFVVYDAELLQFQGILAILLVLLLNLSRALLQKIHFVVP